MSDDYSVPQKVIDALSEFCDCCPICSDHPCDGVMACGPCDHVECTCDEYDDSGDDLDYELMQEAGQ